MIETTAGTDSPLLDALDELFAMATAEPMQPLNLLTEEAVLHWTRVLDGQDVVAPRLNEEGYAPTAFHFGMETRAINQLDDCRLVGGPEVFEEEAARRQERLNAALEDYFGGTGYRSSSDQCDRTMLELVNFSRFWNAWTAAAEQDHQRRWKGRKREGGGGVNLYDPVKGESFLAEARRRMALWEPILNAAIVGWEENHLEPFDRALRDLRNLLKLPPKEQLSYLPPPGFPLRRRGLPRQKVSAFEPEQRPLRSRSVLQVRYLQLRDRLVQGFTADPNLLDDLAVDVVHFTRMVSTNFFMLGSTPGFFERGRAGVPIIRGRPTNHPFLLDPRGFFKKAVLFRNGTYSAAGGALDQMFLQLRQLERFCKFERWGDWARPLRVPIDDAVIAWEENRWDVFTEELLRVAEILRGSDEP